MLSSRPLLRTHWVDGFDPGSSKNQDLFPSTTLAKHANYLWNVTRQCKIEREQAFARVYAKRGEITASGQYREFSNEEILSARAVQPASRFTYERSIDIPLGTLSNEISGVHFEPPVADKYKYHERIPLLRQAAELLQAQ